MKLFNHIFFILIILITISCSSDYEIKESPIAVKGLLNLKEWNFKVDGPNRLYGEWEFYLNKSLTPDDFKSKKNQIKPSYIKIPQFYTDYVFRGKQIPKTGYSSFRLQVEVNSKYEALAIEFNNLTNDTIFYINGKKAKTIDSSTGIIPLGESNWLDSPQNFKTKNNKIDIIMVLQNKRYDETIIRESNFTLGESINLAEKKKHSEYLAIFTLSALLMISFYHLVFFLFRRNDLSILYFAIIGLIYAILSTTMENSLYQTIMPSIHWRGAFTITYISILLLITFLAMYIESIFPDEFNKKVLRFFQLAGGIFTIFVLIFPVEFFIKFSSGLGILTVLLTIYSLNVQIRAIRNKRDIARIFLFASLIISIGAINDTLYGEKIIETAFIGYYCAFTFIFFQGFILSQKFSRTHKNVENLSRELAIKSEELTDKQTSSYNEQAE